MQAITSSLLEPFTLPPSDLRLPTIPRTAILKAPSLPMSL